MEFKEFPKIPRLNREFTITEKIDGTNGCIVVEEGSISDRDGATAVVDINPGGFERKLGGG